MLTFKLAAVGVLLKDKMGSMGMGLAISVLDFGKLRTLIDFC